MIQQNLSPKDQYNKYWYILDLKGQGTSKPEKATNILVYYY